MSKKLEESLGLNPLPMLESEKDYLPEVARDQQTDHDIEQIRDNLYKAVSAAQQAVQDMIVIAQGSQHPKAYEVLNSALKTYADISMGIADLHMKKQRLHGGKQKAEEPGQTNVTNNNTIIVGSTAELQKIINNLKSNSGV